MLYHCTKQECNERKEVMKRVLEREWTEKEKDEIVDIWYEAGKIKLSRVEWDYWWNKKDEPNLKEFLLDRYKKW